jgi:hypothetical protein
MELFLGGDWRWRGVAAAVWLAASGFALRAQEPPIQPEATAQPVATVEPQATAAPASPASQSLEYKAAQSESTQSESTPAAEQAATPSDAESPQPAADDSSSPADKQPETVDFAADVRPILAVHCLKCHDAKMHRGGLSLDSRAGAERGGDSGQSLLGGTLETNELYARVSSDERSYRMPKNADALPPEDIATLRRWVEQGTPWPQPAPDSSGRVLAYIGALSSWFDGYQEEYRYALPYMIGFLLVQIVVLLVLRCRAAYRQQRRWTQGRLAPLGRLSSRVRGSEILLVTLIAVGVVVAAFTRGHFLKIQAQLAKLTEERKISSSPWAATVYGYPPQPVHPKQPKQVSGTYYRGNCERNEALFNGGNYLTSTFHVALCDRGEKPLNPGDSIPADGLYMRCEIERAPGTADELFSPEGMASVLLTKQHVESTDGKQDEEPSHLEVLEAGQRWAAVVSLGKPDESGAWSGTIYLYTGSYHEGHLRGTLHYGIGYQVKAVDGKLSPDSDVWMDSFGNPVFAPPPPAGMLPYQEWFGTQPLPVITGENSKDPKLLGIDEHVEKGFIKPPQKPPANAEAGDEKKQARPDESQKAEGDSKEGEAKEAGPLESVSPGGGTPAADQPKPPADEGASTSRGAPLRMARPPSSTTTCWARR